MWLPIFDLKTIAKDSNSFTVSSMMNRFDVKIGRRWMLLLLLLITCLAWSEGTLEATEILGDYN
jgi:hypothetical protein